VWVISQKKQPGNKAPGGTVTQTISLPGSLPKGSYQVEVRNGNGVTSEKIILK
jgi:hypothetical protein